MVVDTASGAVTRRSLSHRTCEFPSVAPEAHGRAHRHIYSPASSIDHPVWWGPNQVPPPPSPPPPTLVGKGLRTRARGMRGGGVTTRAVCCNRWHIGNAVRHPTTHANQEALAAMHRSL